MIRAVWDGDIASSEALNGFSDNDIAQMEKTINQNPKLKDGVPFASEEKWYAELLRKDSGAKLIQKMIDNFE